MKTILSVINFILITNLSLSQNLFVATNGDDQNPWIINQLLKSISPVVIKIYPGHTDFF